MTSRTQLLKLFRETTGKTVIENKPVDEKIPVPYQISRVQEYQMTGRRG